MGNQGTRGFIAFLLILAAGAAGVEFVFEAIVRHFYPALLIPVIALLAAGVWAINEGLKP